MPRVITHAGQVHRIDEDADADRLYRDAMAATDAETWRRGTFIGVTTICSQRGYERVAMVRVGATIWTARLARNGPGQPYTLEPVSGPFEAAPSLLDQLKGAL